MSDDELRAVWREGMRSTGPVPDATDYDRYNAGIVAGLRAVAEKARRTALEEAAQVADAIDVQAEIDLGIEYEGHAAEVAAAIRCLSDTAQEDR